MLCRTHPSVCRYSVQNECDPKWVGTEADALSTVDDTRPIVFEDNKQKKSGVVKGSHAHAYPMLHYQHFDAPLREICGMGGVGLAGAARPGSIRFSGHAGALPGCLLLLGLGLAELLAKLSAGHEL